MTRPIAALMALFGLLVLGNDRGVPFMGAHCLMAAAQHQGNPNHQEPPPGWFCTPSGWVKDGRQTPEDPCTCHRECMDYEDEDGHKQTQVREDAQCWSYCFKNSCGCEIHNCD